MKKIKKIIWASLVPSIATIPCVIVPIFQSNQIVSKSSRNANFTSFTTEVRICNDIWCNVTFNDSEDGRYCVIPSYCSPSGGGRLFVPSSINYGGIDYPLTKICDRAFKGKDNIIRGVDFTNATNLTEIEEEAFYDCYVWVSDGTKLDFINTKITSIGKKAFFDNGSSKNGILIFPPTLRNLGANAFDNGIFCGKWRVSKIVFTSMTPPSFGWCWGPGMGDALMYVPSQARSQYLSDPYIITGSTDCTEDQIIGAQYIPYVTKDIISVNRIDHNLTNFINVRYTPGEFQIKIQNFLGLYFKDVETGQINSEFKFENDVFSWDENIKTKTYNLQLCSTVDKDFPTNVTFKITINDILEINDGTQNIHVISGQSGMTQKPWKAYLNHEEISDNLEWKFTSDDPKIVEAFHVNDDGTIIWDSFSHSSGVFLGVITCTYNNTVSASASIYILIKESSAYTVQGGSTVLNGVEGKSGIDPNIWTLKKDEESIVAEEWSIIGENIDGITISNGKISWLDNIKCGVYSFSVKSKTHDEFTGLEIEAISGLCILTINPSDISIKNGSLQLKGYTRRAGWDKNAWQLYIADTKIEKVKWSINVDKHPEWFLIHSDGTVIWNNNVVSGIYNIKLSCSYFYEGSVFVATLDDTIKLTIYDAPYLVTGNHLIQTTEHTAGHDDSIWSIEINGVPISQHVNWSLKSTSGILNENIWIYNGQIIWNQQLGLGIYSFYVIAEFEIDGVQYSLKDDISVTLLIKPDLNIRDGDYNLSGIHGVEGQTLNVWNIYLNGELVDWKKVNYELEFDEKYENNQIKIDSSSSLISWTQNTPPGIYQFRVKAYVNLDYSIYQIETDTIILTIVDMPNNKSNIPLIFGLGLGVGTPVLFAISFGITYGVLKLGKKRKNN